MMPTPRELPIYCAVAVLVVGAVWATLWALCAYAKRMTGPDPAAPSNRRARPPAHGFDVLPLNTESRRDEPVPNRRQFSRQAMSDQTPTEPDVVKTIDQLLAESRELRQRSLVLEARAIELSRKLDERDAQPASPNG